MAQPPLRSYGRRRSKYLRESQKQRLDAFFAAPETQKLVSAVAETQPIALADLFASPCEDYVLEIGFGDGTHLVSLAAAHPETGFIGAEPYLDGVAKLLRTIETQDLHNIRIFADDVRLLFNGLAEESLPEVYLLHPDPWPKKRHHKRRIVTTPFIDSIARLLKPQGRLIIQSDSADYTAWILALMLAHDEFSWCAQTPQDWQPSGKNLTAYARKADRQHHPIRHLQFIRQGKKKIAPKINLC